MAKKEEEEYVNPETIERHENAFKKHAKGGKLDVRDILDTLIDAKEELYTEDDIVDALEVMQIKNEPLDQEKFFDLIGILKDPETIKDAFAVFDRERTGIVPEGDLREWLHKYSNLKGKEIEEVIENAAASNDGKLNYVAFVDYWSKQ